MRKHKGFSVVMLAVFVILAFMVSTVWAENQSTIQIVDCEGLSGSNVDVPVHFIDSVGAGGGVIELLYDPEAVVPVRVIQNSELPFAIPEDEENDLEIVANLDYAPGKVKIAWAVNPNEGLSGEGLLCHVRFQIKKLGSTDVSITELSCLADTEASIIPCSFIDGQITTGDLAEISYGDINGDGDIDFLDAILALRYATGLIELAQNQALSAKVNNDGEDVDFVDAILILRRSTGLIPIFPIEES